MICEDGVYTPPLVNSKAPLPIISYKQTDLTDVECSICCYPIKFIARVNCSNDHPICAICVIRLKDRYTKLKEKLQKTRKELEKDKKNNKRLKVLAEEEKELKWQCPYCKIPWYRVDFYKATIDNMKNLFELKNNKLIFNEILDIYIANNIKDYFDKCLSIICTICPKKKH